MRTLASEVVAQLFRSFHLLLRIIKIHKLNARILEERNFKGYKTLDAICLSEARLALRCPNEGEP